jgi:WD40 repeat protein
MLAAGVLAGMQISIKADLPVGGATFTITGGDIRQIFAARELVAKAAEGLNLKDESGRREFLVRYFKSRREHPELSALKISCAEFPLVEPSGPAANAPAGASSSASGVSEQARRDLMAMLSVPEYQGQAGYAKFAAGLRTWLGKNLSPANAATVAEFHVLLLQSTMTLAPALAAQLRLPCNWILSNQISIPDPGAVAKQEPKQKSKNRAPEDSDIPVGGCNRGIAGGRELTECHIKSGGEVYVAYRLDAGAISTARVTLQETVLNPSTAGMAGALQTLKATPELEETVRGQVLGAATVFMPAPGWKPPSKREQPALRQSPSAYRGNQMCQYQRTAWVVAPSGVRAGDVDELPNGGYVATGEQGEILAVWGHDFTAAQAEKLHGFKDGAGNLYPLPVTVHTYSGAGGKRYSMAVFDRRHFVMWGTWLEGATPTAPNILDPKLFRVLETARGGVSRPGPEIAPSASVTPLPKPPAPASPSPKPAPPVRRFASALIREFQPPGELWMERVQFSPDGRSILCERGMERTYSLIDVATGLNDRAFLKVEPWGSHPFAISSDGRSGAVAANAGEIRIYDLPGWSLRQTLRGVPSLVREIRWMPDGKGVVLQSGRDVSLWSAESGEQRWTAKIEGNLMAISPDGRYIAAGERAILSDAKAASGYNVEILPVDRPNEIVRFPAHTLVVTSLNFAPDSRTLASASSDKTVKFWSVADQKLLRVLQGHEKGVRSVRFTSGGKTVVSGGLDDTLRMWDAAAGTQSSQTPLDSSIICMDISPDGRSVVVGHMNGRVSVYDLQKLVAAGQDK